MIYPSNPNPTNLKLYYTDFFSILKEHSPMTAGRPIWEDSIFPLDRFIMDCVAQDLIQIHKDKQTVALKLRAANCVDYRFITIGYSNEIQPSDLISKWRIVEQSKWKWGDDRIQRFEFYRDDGKYHPHIHMLIYTNKKPSQIIKELSSKTNIPKNFIDVKSGRYVDHKNYIYGNKRESKQSDMDKDKLIRDKLDLEEVEIKTIEKLTFSENKNIV